MTPPTTVDDDVAEPSSGPGPRRGLDRRSVLVAAAIGLVAAVVAGLVTAQLMSSRDGGGEGTLTSVSQVPDRPFTRFDGSKGSLSDYKGQRLVVNFFSSTCAPCKREMPDFEKVARQAGDEITFVGIDVQDSTAAGKALVARTGITYDVGQDPDGAIFSDVGATLLPATAFVAADGTVMELHTGRLSADELRKKISNNLLAGG